MLRKSALSISITFGMVGVLLAGEGAPVDFKSKPTVKTRDKQVEISFEASTKTDVEVAILDGSGQIVRHLAAGLLGGNAPAPLKPDVLAQELAWDFKDDFGRKVPAGQYSARVSLGLKPQFDRMLGSDPNTLGTIRGLATSSEGELFVLNLGSHVHGGFGSAVCSVLDREGTYKRTIMPYQASCLPDKVGEFGVLDLGDKGRYPWIHASHLKTVYPFSAQPSLQRPLVMPDGRVILTMPVQGKSTMLVAVNARDGSAPKSGAIGPAFREVANTKKDWMSGYACLAAAPDGETIYISGIASQKRYKKIKWKHAVYRAKWTDKTISPFIGNPEEPGKGDKGLDQPKGIAVDGEGRIYVADRGNNRIAVFSPEGKFLNEIPVELPYMLDVHRKTGAIYVMKGDPPTNIVKFKNHKEVDPVYDHAVPGMRVRAKGKKAFGAYCVFAVDGSGDEPVLWLGSATSYERFNLYRLVETNGKPGKPDEKGTGQGFRAVRSVKVDKKRDVLYIMRGGDSESPSRLRYFMKVNGADGKSTTIKSLSGTYEKLVPSHFTFGDDGYIYVVCGSRKIYKYDRDLKPANYKGKDTNVMDPFPPDYKYTHHLMGRGVAADRNGNIYLLHENLPQPHKRYGLSSWGPDGALRKKELISRLTAGVLSVRVDLAGNLYVGERVKPTGQPVPDDMKGKVNTEKTAKAGNHYPIMYGSVLKFPPTGGAGVGPEIEGRKALVAYDAVVGIKGDLWQYFGVGAIPAYRGGCNQYIHTKCHCEGIRFDVDGYGRVFCPDGGRFRVAILDTNGNEIGFMGEYGNRDSAGPKSAVPGPDIPLAWPSAVGVSDQAVYVSDVLNRRIVRARLAHKQSATCAVRVP